MTSKIVGTDGQPIEISLLNQEFAGTSFTGVRNPWMMLTVAGRLTPAYLAQVLQGAADNNGWQYFILAQEMEERDPHYASVLGTRKRAVEGIEAVVVPASQSKEDVAIADEVRELCGAPEFGDAIAGALDGIAKGVSCTEIMWDRSGPQWYPNAYKWRDQRFFRFDLDTGEKPLLIDQKDMMGIPLPPYKFIIHNPKLKMGIPLRGGLARLLAVTYMCKSYSITDWMSFIEVYGMPIRIGRYGPNATPADRAVLRDAVQNIGSDAAAILPDGMRIEFQEITAGAGGDKLFATIADYFDSQTSKAILGQTLSADAKPTGLGSGTSDLQGEVRIDIKRSDGKQLGRTLTRDLIKPYVDLNHGPRDPRGYPRVMFPVPDPEDLDLLARALPQLVPLGLRVRSADVSKKFNLDVPAEGEDESGLLHAQSTPAPAVSTDPEDGHPALNREAGDGDSIDALADSAASDWKPIMDPFMKPLLDLVDGAADEQEFMAKLPGVLYDMKAGPLLEKLAISAFKARGLGDGTPAPV